MIFSLAFSINAVELIPYIVDWDTVDLSDLGLGSKLAIYIHTSQQNAFTLLASEISGLSSDIVTEKIWLTLKEDKSTIEIYYEDVNGKTQFAGTITPPNDEFFIQINQHGEEVGFKFTSGVIEFGASDYYIYLALNTLREDYIKTMWGISYRGSWGLGFSKLGNMQQEAEAEEVIWGDESQEVQIGTDSNDYITPCGIVVKSPATHGPSEQVLFYVPVTLSCLPDLIIEDITFFPENPLADETFTVKAIVKNVGTKEILVGGIIPTWRARISIDGTSDDWGAGRNLQPDEIYSFSKSLKLSEGTYNVVTEVDINNAITELNENNNERTETFPVVKLTCTEDWSCTEWSSCVGGYKTRTCTDSNNCGAIVNKPAESKSCVIGECTSGETKSCGSDIGRCKKGTQTCEDGEWSDCVGEISPIKEICNNNVDDDCDGLIDEYCLAGTCYDGIQNQGEEGIDCGGPCPTPCPVIEVCNNNGICETHLGETQENCLNDCPVCLGCEVFGTCVAQGRRFSIDKTSSYCSITREVLPQKEVGKSCQEDYECLSNECGNGKCISTYGLLQRIWNFIKRIFGAG